jgi:hypothetical protein
MDPREGTKMPVEKFKFYLLPYTPNLASQKYFLKKLDFLIFLKSFPAETAVGINELLT